MRLVLTLVAPLFVAASIAVPAVAEEGPRADVVVEGLDNPRQLAWGPGGSLLVAEAGAGGQRCGPTGCFGYTGSVSRVAQPRTTTDARPQRVVTGLFSGAAPDGAMAVGPAGVAVTGLGNVVVATMHDPPDAISIDHHEHAGSLLRATVDGQASPVADLAGFQDGGPSNPVGVLALRGRRLVADAGANAVVEVRPDGSMRTFAAFEPRDGVESVPTAVAAGPDGSVYVGELAGYVPEAACVWRLSPAGTDRTCAADGFTAIMGLAVGRDGSLYVAELGGRLWKVDPDGQREFVEVPDPAGVAVDERDHVYVSAYSLSPAEGASHPWTGAEMQPGQVWRLRF